MALWAAASLENAIVEFGEYLGFSAIVVAILLATAVMVWQSSRSSARIRLDTKIEEQGWKLDARIEEQGRKLDARIERQFESLRADIRNQGIRPSEPEREQARPDVVNSVLLHQRRSRGVGG